MVDIVPGVGYDGLRRTANGKKEAMSQRTEVKVITRLERRRSTANGGPVYVVYFDDATSARTVADAMFTYGLENAELRDVSVIVTFTRTGRVADVVPAPRYRVGDADPTPDDGDEPCERACYPVGSCTWSVDHRGQHVAGNGVTVVGVVD